MTQLPFPQATQSPASGDDSGRLPVVELVMVTLANVVINTTYRMVYPFLPAIGRGLGVAPGAMRLLVGARSATGFASPLFGPATDRFGRRAVMQMGLLVLVVSLMLVPLSPFLWVSLVALVLMALPKVAYGPAAQAYVGDRVPYARRGRAFGIVESSWSAGLLVGAPLIGFAIQRFGWRTPFVGLAGLAALAWLAMQAFVRRDSGGPAGVGGSQAQRWGLLWRQPAVLGVLGFAALIDTANEAMFVVYGQWMEGTFGLQVSTLGLLTAIIGVADLTGELVIATLSDRIGKRRVVVIGAVMSALAYVGLPWLGVKLPVALAVLFVMFVSFEAMIVASALVASELVPAARGTMMAALGTSFAVGRTLGALLAGWLWDMGGFALNGAAAGFLNLLALFLVLTVVSEAPMQASEVPDAAI